LVGDQGHEMQLTLLARAAGRSGAVPALRTTLVVLSNMMGVGPAM
jgi:hypothetical protein